MNTTTQKKLKILIERLIREESNEKEPGPDFFNVLDNLEKNFKIEVGRMSSTSTEYYLYPKKSRSRSVYTVSHLHSSQSPEFLLSYTNSSGKLIHTNKKYSEGEIVNILKNIDF